MSQTPQHLILPDPEEGWAAWSSPFKNAFPVIGHLKDHAIKVPHAVVGLPSKQVRSIGLVLPQATPDLLPAMVSAQLERKGLVSDALSHGKGYVYHVLSQTNGQQLISVDLFSQALPEDWLLPDSVNYVAAHRVYALPQQDLILTEEQGQIVLWCTAAGAVWCNCVLGQSEALSEEELLRELTLAKLSLESQDGLGSFRGITLVGEKLHAHELGLHAALKLPVSCVRSLEKLPLKTWQALPSHLPEDIRATQKSKVRRKQWILAGIVGAMVYAVLFTAGYFYLQKLERQVVELSQEIEKTAIPAQHVKQATQRWKSLEPAIDYRRYPIIQLGQLNSILPPSGVLIKKFTTKVDEIEIQGDSRDAQTATQLLEDLKKNPKTSRFDWNMPVPSVRNNIATFKIQGKLH